MLEKLAITRISVAVFGVAVSRIWTLNTFQRSRFQVSLLPVGKKLDLQVP